MLGGSPAERAPRYVARREQSRELLETKPVGHIEGPCLEMDLPEEMHSDSPVGFIRTVSEHEMEETELGDEK
jgi:hypothetical protein